MERRRGGNQGRSLATDRRPGAVHRVPPILSCVRSRSDIMVSLRALGVCCVALGMAGWMVLIVGPVRDAAATAEDEPGVQAGPEGAACEERPAFRLAGVRYLVKDVDRSVA